MKYKLVIKEEAIADARSAYLWYENELTGLGEKLLSAIDNSYKTILKNPYIYQVRHENTRFALVKKFPFILIYEVSESSIIVYFIIHSSKDDKSWKKQLE